MTAAREFPLDLADRCVKCGLCLPHCPTYGVSGVEGESPRGRIALLQGLATGRLEPTEAMVMHIDRCLGCRACERACPAGVPYGEVLDGGRALLAAKGARAPFAIRALRGVLTRPVWLRLALGAARVPGVQALARRMGGLPAAAAALLPADSPHPASRRAGRPAAAPAGEQAASVAQLFLGCVGGAIDRRTLDDTRHALAVAGWRVETPREQGCCGAMHQHGGQPAHAQVLARANLVAFRGEGPIVACASGCAATLREYARLAGPEAADWAGRVCDPAELLAEASLPLRRSRWRRIALHLPCTQRNVTGSGDATRRMLALIPDTEIRELPPGCCGAAGEHVLRHPALADTLRAPIIEALLADPPDVLATSNIGCALHFAAGLARAGLEIPVLHPVSVLASALE